MNPELRLRLKPALHARLRDYANLQGAAMSDVVVMALLAFLPAPKPVEPAKPVSHAPKLVRELKTSPRYVYVPATGLFYGRPRLALPDWRPCVPKRYSPEVTAPPGDRGWGIFEGGWLKWDGEPLDIWAMLDSEEAEEVTDKHKRLMDVEPLPPLMRA